MPILRHSPSAADKPAGLRGLTPGVILAAAGLALTAAVTLFYGLGNFGLVGPDEPRYAAIAWAMAHTGNYITPRLAGRIWLEKPVLYYWLAAIAFRLFRAGTAAARAPNSVLALISVVALSVWLARRHSRRAGWLAAALGFSSAFIIGFGRAASTDMPLAALMTLSLICAYEGLRADSSAVARIWLMGAGAGLGLAVLAKGPVAGVLEAGLVLPWIILQRRAGAWRRLLSPWPWLVFIAVAFPWYTALTWRHPGFFRFFFWQQNLERFATNRFHHPEPFWYYLPVLAGAIFPWCGWLGPPLAEAAAAARPGWRRWRARQSWADEATERGPLLLWLALWTLFPIIFFSLSASKLPGYILPAVPGCLGMIAAIAAEHWDSFPRWALVITAALASLIPAGVWLLPWMLAPRAEQPPLAWVWRQTPLWLICAALAVILLQWAWRRRTLLLSATTMLLVTLGTGLTLARWGGAIDRAASTRPLAKAIAQFCGESYASVLEAGSGGGHCPLYGWQADRNLVYGLEFYRHARLAELNRMPHWPEQGLAVLRWRSIPAFMRAALAHRRRLREALPTPPGADWALVWIRRNAGSLNAQNVESAIHVQHFPGNAAAEIARQKDRRVADFARIGVAP